MIKRALSGAHAGAIDAYIISGTESASDVLEVLLLMKEASLASAGGEKAMLRIVPLFEAGATLESAPETIEKLLSTPVYRQALLAVGDHQEIMIGYSDSNKDVGYVASGWQAYRAQSRIAEVLRGHGVRWIFFHGRGGAIGRGGGPTNGAILALPPGTVEGRLKMTEQGEVLTAKYTVGEIAHRELELTTSATLRGRRPAAGGRGRDRRPSVCSSTSRSSRRWPQHPRRCTRESCTRIRTSSSSSSTSRRSQEVSRLRLGSRPARRQAAGGIDDLRAIPWVFAWTQSRIVLPAWLGLGTALREARERHGLETLQAMGSDWPFFAALISNAEMGCSKADPGIARRYMRYGTTSTARERIWGQLDAELELACSELIADPRRHPAARLRAGPAVVDRPPQPLCRPAVIHPDRVAAPPPRHGCGGDRRRRSAIDTAARSRTGARQPPGDQRDRQRPAEYGMSAVDDP